MKSLLLALQFLTAIPVKIKQVSDRDIAKSLIFFPAIGMFLGLALVGLDSVLPVLYFESFISNIILVVVLVILTAGLHLDGLSDTFDALLSGKDRQEMLNIMKDPHIGVMGVLSLICAILLKISFLSEISAANRQVSLFLMCVLSRWSLVFSIYFFPYARQEGRAKKFFELKNTGIFLLCAILTLAFAYAIWQVNGLKVFVTAVTCVYLMNKLISKKIGGLTGDTLGAVNELTEILVLFIICIMERTAI